MCFFALGRLAMPVDCELITTVNDILVATLRIGQPSFEMFLQV
jgi:hypothetical protein